MADLQTVGQRIQYIRTKRGLTLDRLAGQAGVSKSFLWEVEHDRSGISGEKLLRVTNALGSSLDFLLRGESAPEHYRPTIGIPVELSELAEELGLTYKETLTLLEIDRSIVARRSPKSSNHKTKEDWKELFKGVKRFLGASP